MVLTVGTFTCGTSPLSRCRRRSEGRVSDTLLCRCLESWSHDGSKNESKMFGEEARVIQGARFQVFGSFRL